MTTNRKGKITLPGVDDSHDSLTVLETSDCSIHCVELGEMQNLIYLVVDRASAQAAIVDPAWDVPRLQDWAAQHQVAITDILISHYHHDHTNGVQALADSTGARVHLHETEAAFWSGTPDAAIRHPDRAVIRVGDTRIQILHTPGHSPGSVCFHIDQALITGDTLFVYGCGRCDLPGGDSEQMFHSLQGLSQDFPGDTLVLPGHHYAAEITSSLGEQRRANPFLRFTRPADFVWFREHHNEHRHPPYRPVPPGQPAW